MDERPTSADPKDSIINRLRLVGIPYMYLEARYYYQEELPPFLSTRLNYEILRPDDNQRTTEVILTNGGKWPAMLKKKEVKARSWNVKDLPAYTHWFFTININGRRLIAKELDRGFCIWLGVEKGFSTTFMAFPFPNMSHHAKNKNGETSDSPALNPTSLTIPSRQHNQKQTIPPTPSPSTHHDPQIPTTCLTAQQLHNTTFYLALPPNPNFSPIRFSYFPTPTDFITPILSALNVNPFPSASASRALDFCQITLMWLPHNHPNRVFLIRGKSRQDAILGAGSDRNYEGFEGFLRFLETAREVWGWGVKAVVVEVCLKGRAGDGWGMGGWGIGFWGVVDWDCREIEREIPPPFTSFFILLLSLNSSCITLRYIHTIPENKITSIYLFLFEKKKTKLSIFFRNSIPTPPFDYIHPFLSFYIRLSATLDRSAL